MKASSRPASGGAVVRWGVIERAMEALAPRAAGKRFAAKLLLANLRRSYDAASYERGRTSRRGSSTAADSEIAYAGAVLRDQMRDLVRNNPLAAKAVQVLVNNLVGAGIRPRAASTSPALNKKVDDLWAKWSQECDAHGHTDFHGLISLAVRGMIEGGDMFALKRGRYPSDGLSVPVQIELREADHLDAGRIYNQQGGNRISQGIETDAIGRRVAYWMFPDHPGDSTNPGGQITQSVRVDANRVAHLFERQRVQNRGVPWGTPAMTAISHVRDYQEAELVRKKIEACVVGVVFSDDETQESIAPSIVDSDGEKIEQFEPGMIAYARNGKDIKFNQPASSGGVGEWHRVQLHIISAGFRVPYELMTGDLSQVNFSSSRVGLNEFRRMIEAVQWQTIIPMLCEPIWHWFLEAAATAGLIRTADVPAEWAPPKFESVNPLQDAEADLLETRAGFATWAQQVAKRGYDPEKMLGEVEKFNALFDAKGVVFDSDPRKVSKAGLTQSNKAAATDPAAPASQN
jgi:lambda family phage portal protein